MQMENIWHFEILITIFIQSLGGWLTRIMKFFTFLGTAEFFTVVMPVFYWCLDAALGLRVGVILLINTALVDSLKLLFHFPRPYWFDTRVKAFSTENTFGMPSSHSSGAFSVWGLIAVTFKRRWITIVCAALIFFIGLSRIYLGVHFTSDVLVGWTLGGIILFLFLKFEKPILRWLKTLNLIQSIMLAISTSFILMLPTLIFYFIFSSTPIPPEWIINATAANPNVPFNPFSLSGTITLGGTWLGVWLGFALFYHSRGMYDASGSLVQRLIRLGIGMIGILILWYGLDKIFPNTEDTIGFILRFVRYSLVGLWITDWAPMIFQKLKIARIGTLNGG
jgi:membrane-associated phospholipid phosphatase